MSQTPETPAADSEAATMCENCPEKGNTNGEIRPEDWQLSLSHYEDNGELVGPSTPMTVETSAFADLGPSADPEDDHLVTDGSGFWLKRDDTGAVAETIRAAEAQGVALEEDIDLTMGEIVCERIRKCTGPIEEEPIEGLSEDTTVPQLVCGGYNRRVLLDFLRDRVAARQVPNPPAPQ
jgi:hypothetical protein